MKTYSKKKQILEEKRGGGEKKKKKKKKPKRRGEAILLKNQFEAGVGGEFKLNNQLLNPDVPTLASQNKLKISPKRLPFVIFIIKYNIILIRKNPSESIN